MDVSSRRATLDDVPFLAALAAHAEVEPFLAVSRASTPEAIAERVVRMVQDGAVVSVTGKVIKMRTDTVCIHGDTPGAVDIARGVRQALKIAGIEVAPFKKASKRAA